MASSEEEAVAMVEGFNSGLDAWVTKLHGELSVAPAHEGEIPFEIVHEIEPPFEIACDDAVFEDMHSYRMFSGAKVETVWSMEHEAAHTNFDFDFVSGFEAGSFGLDYELRESINGMESSSLSRLFRVIRDWGLDSFAKDEEPTEAAAGPGEVIGTTLVAGSAPAMYLEGPAEEMFFTLLDESHHKLLERQADKNLWTWFANFREVALDAFERGRSISGAEILEMVKRALTQKRSLPRLRAPRARHGRAERLLRLADSIAPNAPPRPPLPIGQAIEAG